MSAAVHWAELALCAQVGGDLWFPEKGEPTRNPKRVCRACEVRAECLDYALEHGIRDGVWGGLSDRERRRRHRDRKTSMIPGTAGDATTGRK